jgi:hypothetical protein
MELESYQSPFSCSVRRLSDREIERRYDGRLTPPRDRGAPWTTAPRYPLWLEWAMIGA